MILALTHPATVALGYDEAVVVENLGGLSLILAVLFAVSGLLRGGQFGKKVLGKITLFPTLLLVFVLGMMLITEQRNTMDLFRLSEMFRDLDGELYNPAARIHFFGQSRTLNGRFIGRFLCRYGRGAGPAFAVTLHDQLPWRYHRAVRLCPGSQPAGHDPHAVWLPYLKLKAGLISWPTRC